MGIVILLVLLAIAACALTFGIMDIRYCGREDSSEEDSSEEDSSEEDPSQKYELAIRRAMEEATEDAWRAQQKRLLDAQFRLKMAALKAGGAMLWQMAKSSRRPFGDDDDPHM